MYSYVIETSLEYANCIFWRGIGSPPFPKNEVFGYDTKLYLMVRLQFWRSGEYGVPLHCHYS